MRNNKVREYGKIASENKARTRRNYITDYKTNICKKKKRKQKEKRNYQNAIKVANRH